MMIAPEMYIDGFKNKTLDQCIAERDELYKILKKVENDEYSEEEKQYTTSPVFQYYWYLEVFSLINDLILEKYQDEEEKKQRSNYMKLDEKKIIDYLKNHVGENTTTYMLAKDSGALEGEFDGMETDLAIRKIAEENGFRLNSSHHNNELLGMPYSIDFYIEKA